MKNKKEITSSDLEKNNVPWAMIDDISKPLAQGEFAIVANTARADEPGIHWICIARLSGPVAYIYDPLGPDNERPHDDVMLAELERAGARRIAWFPSRTQAATSHHCGWLAMAVCKLLSEARPADPRAASGVIRAYFRPATAPGAARDNVRQLLRAGGYVP